MKMSITKSILILAIAILAGTTAVSQAIDQLPPTSHVIAKMMEADAVRHSEMTGYTVLRRYIAVNKKRHAEMLVRVSCDGTGADHFSILSEKGSRAIRNHVFRKILREEAKVSRRGTRKSTLLTPANYMFQIMGEQAIGSGPAYVIAVSPKSISKYSIEGTIWVDASDYSIVRIEGQPARTPSFWVRSVQFVHTYRKVGRFWLASSTRTKSRIWIFGDSELTIQDFDYTLNTPADNATQADNELRQDEQQP